MKSHVHIWPAKTLVVLFLLSAALTAQQPIEIDQELALRVDAQRRAGWATAWLHSEDSLRVAWGAWLARRDHQTAQIPLLIDQRADRSVPLPVLSEHGVRAPMTTFSKPIY